MCRQKTCSLRTLLWKHILPSGLDILNLTITRKAQSYWNLFDLEECGQTYTRKCAEKIWQDHPGARRKWKAGRPSKLSWSLVQRNLCFDPKKLVTERPLSKGYTKSDKKIQMIKTLVFISLQRFLAVYIECLQWIMIS